MRKTVLLCLALLLALSGSAQAARDKYKVIHLWGTEPIMERTYGVSRGEPFITDSFTREEPKLAAVYMNSYNWADIYVRHLTTSTAAQLQKKEGPVYINVPMAGARRTCYGYPAPTLYERQWFNVFPRCGFYADFSPAYILMSGEYRLYCHSQSTARTHDEFYRFNSYMGLNLLNLN
jgi:hypothetical protein